MSSYVSLLEPNELMSSLVCVLSWIDDLMSMERIDTIVICLVVGVLLKHHTERIPDQDRECALTLVQGSS